MNPPSDNSKLSLSLSFSGLDYSGGGEQLACQDIMITSHGCFFDWSGLKFAWRLHGHKNLGAGQLPSGLRVPLLLRIFGHALFLYHEQFCFPLLSTPTMASLFSFHSTYLLGTNQPPTRGAESLSAALCLSWPGALNSRWEAGPSFLSTTKKIPNHLIPSCTCDSST